MDGYHDAARRTNGVFEDLLEQESRWYVMHVDKARQLGVVVEPVSDVVCNARPIGIVLGVTEKDRKAQPVLLKGAAVVRRVLAWRQTMP